MVYGRVMSMKCFALSMLMRHEGQVAANKPK
jgi:hypothetical protein